MGHFNVFIKIMKSRKPYRFDLVTLFPNECLTYTRASILGRAVRTNRICVTATNPRDFTQDTRKTVDDRPYGGGPGMVMMLPPIFRAFRSLRIRKARKDVRVLLMSARAKIFTQADARRLAGAYQRLVLICGRYDGIDDRVAQYITDEEVSIGNYVLAGGELAALVVIEAVSRHIPGVLGKEASLEEQKGLYPVYTRPQSFRAGKEKWDVPSVLLSGHAEKIAHWRKERGLFSFDREKYSR